MDAKFTINSEKQEKCLKHNEDKKFYCKACKISLCADCVVTLHDKNHKIINKK